ncbi:MULTISPECIES: CDP-glycerol glycerophosphotransferase family protein [unclassified Bacillus (in: firmicutes)]|uniref:CDP-glycerol glycerophosphotransferase family protein n=1 Tax=unclassified Bacillus (in: firmicutes) TaxID=185979 RepID=UPI0008E60BB8|nr:MULTISPECIES: CDP-glycerol glycerophosphotransferase family protein [unclassified Bacillus (in: firmicutes)]SFB21062.1 CDP-glycerol:poly(glycerophosphate) glycerophosphotransferase [Bacillus sp. UNCCL13]SFQ90956.1 CDP-glycerol:poly(glycerophosphate) glycerophosphotransferase [Bacillus sp. cl95]
MRKTIVSLYQFLFYKVLFSIFKLFPTDQKKIIYISHYGNRFGCNPKSMFEYVVENYPEYKNIVVLNQQGHNHAEENVKYVSYYSVAFLIELATSKYWVVNTNLNPYLKPKKGTEYLQTWHGAGAFKKFGLDLPDSREKEKQSWKKDTSHWTKMLSSSESIIDIYSSACGIDKTIIHPTGLPRNDVFFQTKDTLKRKEEFYKTYNINPNKKIILYAPTYRDMNNDNPLNLDFSRLQKDLGEEYVFVLKLHPFLAKYQFETKEDGEKFVFNLSAIDDIQDLLLIADVLITDYSSVIFDYALTGKPMLFYSYDLEEYERGFYFEYKGFVPGPIVYTQEQLTAQLQNYDQLYAQHHDQVIAFAKEYNAGFDGKSTEKAVNLLLNK